MGKTLKKVIKEDPEDSVQTSAGEHGGEKMWIKEIKKLFINSYVLNVIMNLQAMVIRPGSTVQSIVL